MEVEGLGAQAEEDTWSEKEFGKFFFGPPDVFG
jgi:hypothetical protein